MSANIQSVWDWVSGAPLRVIAILAGAIAINIFGKRAITRAMDRLANTDLKPGPGEVHRQKERARTTGNVLNSILVATTWLIAIFMVTGELGFNLGPLIASAGVIGVALGLGAQTIVRDLLAGIFMLIEDQFGVGDEVEMFEVQGRVEKVGLRITTVRGTDGTAWHLRNGEILKVGNKSQRN